MRRNTDQPPAAPAVVWPSEEGRHTVVQNNQFAWQRHTDAARNHHDYAERLNAEIGEKTRQWEQLRQEIDAKTQEKQQQDHYATQEQAAADAYAAALQALGEQPPPPVDRLVAGSNGMSPLEAAAHAAAWNGARPNSASGAPIGELDERSKQVLGEFLDEHAAIGQDGTR
ncbi:hypothetical protein AB0395_47080 [Streptosporangium sp. NPDC051023]|uniref:hypothetical protein n=1 Tax=Streptosporangium sp. NPDC051023 TaxID=3155410 RepID=UPI00344DD3BA